MINNNYTAGRQTEVSFGKFLKEHKATFRLLNLEEVLNQEEVIELSLKWESQKVSSLLRKAKITLEELHTWSISKLLDYLFKVDYLIEVESENGKPMWVALDVTTDHSKLSVKEFEMKQLRGPFKELGISLGLIILWEPNVYSPSTSYERAGMIVETIDFLIENKKTAGTVILS